MKLCVVLCVFGLLAAFTTGCDKPKAEPVKAVAVEQQACTQESKPVAKAEKAEVKQEAVKEEAKAEKAKPAKKAKKADKAAKK